MLQLKRNNERNRIVEKAHHSRKNTTTTLTIKQNQGIIVSLKL
jgi:hypothetical protein